MDSKQHSKLVPASGNLGDGMANSPVTAPVTKGNTTGVPTKDIGDVKSMSNATSIKGAFNGAQNTNTGRRD